MKVPNNLAQEHCQCGHLRGAHITLIAFGHGPCGQCDCQKFTWVKKPDGGYTYTEA